MVIALTREFTSWKFKIIEGPKLTVSELIDVCNLICSENVIESDNIIEISCDNSDDSAYIRGKQNVMKEIIEYEVVPVFRQMIGNAYYFDVFAIDDELHSYMLGYAILFTTHVKISLTSKIPDDFNLNELTDLIREQADEVKKEFDNEKKYRTFNIHF